MIKLKHNKLRKQTVFKHGMFPVNNIVIHLVKKGVLMRDPARIDEILSQLSRIWKAHPDFRFNQLLYILQSEFSEANKGYGKVESEEVDGFKRVGFDLFNVEDESFQKYLTKTLDSGSWGKGV